MQRSIIVADIHINASRNREFEWERLKALAGEILAVLDCDTRLILAGDTFDKNSPTKFDIYLFYKFIAKLRNTNLQIVILILGGNHDYDIFKYLPTKGFTYIHEPTELEDIILIPWAYITTYTKQLTKKVSKPLISHARCTIPPFITEEVSISKLSQKHPLVILGDIHSPLQPYDNCYYCSSPSATSFSSSTIDGHGFLILEEDASVTRVSIEIPTKLKVTFQSVKEAKEGLKKLDKHNLYRVVINDTPDKLVGIQRLKASNTYLEAVPIITQEIVEIQEGDSIETMDLEAALFEYVEKAYSYPSGAITIARNLI